MKSQTHSRAAGLLFPSLLVISLSLSGPAVASEAQSVSFEGAKFVNQGLVAVGRVPADAKDKLGDTLGGIGSGMVADRGSWKREGDTYTGTFYMLPDRGWNTEGTLDYPGRLQKFSVSLTPYSGAEALAAGPAQQAQLKLTYDDSILLHEANGTPTTGLDANEVRKAADGFPDLPSAGGKISVDNEGVVLTADGSF